MGRSISTNQSSTAYTNAPIAQENVTNPINLSNSSGNVLGTSLTGHNNTFLDGGAIEKAFNFGSDAVKIIADLTRSSNATAQSAASGATMLATQAQTALDTNKNQDALTDWTQNKTLIFGGVLVAIAYFYFRR